MLHHSNMINIEAKVHSLLTIAFPPSHSAGRDLSALRKVVARFAHVPCIYDCHPYALVAVPLLQIPIAHHLFDLHQIEILYLSL